ncbi:MAG TPA: cobalamin biosynthesis protein, partial [Pararhizobium sp.]|nr:cobalamin biosynthesis protein [Pararhizobium sp.]
VLGLPGLFAYKMLNTADSMIGHKTERHLDFGQGAAKLDDAANWPAARLSALFIAASAAWREGRDAWQKAWNAALKDARFHRSPNAGWPEAAMAGALDMALGGPRSYGGVAVRERMMNAGARQNANAGDIDRALVLFWRACLVLTVLVLIITCLASI